MLRTICLDCSKDITADVAPITSCYVNGHTIVEAEEKDNKTSQKKTKIKVYSGIVTKDGHGREPYFRHH